MSVCNSTGILLRARASQGIDELEFVSDVSIRSSGRITFGVSSIWEIILLRLNNEKDLEERSRR